MPYRYNIGTYDVTNAQYVEFLSAKASASDPYGLWALAMNPGGLEGAITRSGSGPYSYSVTPGDANKPVVFVSFFDAIRFVNWLQNGQGNGDTESGTYRITNGGNNSGSVTIPDALTRAAWAATNSFHWLLPSENEWYKAAYYNSAALNYYAYPFQNNTSPTGMAPPGDSNSGNFFHSANNYDGNGSNLSDVGAYPNSLSPFGSFDMGGDVYQWNDTTINSQQFGTQMGFRGGSWGVAPSHSQIFVNGFVSPGNELADAGFRVANVPEPCSALLLLVALSCFLTFARRLRAFMPANGRS